MHFIFILLLFISTCFGQRQTLDSAEGLVSYINDSLSLSQNDIYSKCLDWVTDTYSSTKGVIDEKDRESGIIIIKSVYPAQKLLFKVADVRYSLKIKIKENKLKMSFETGEWILLLKVIPNHLQPNQVFAN